MPQEMPNYVSRTHEAIVLLAKTNEQVNELLIKNLHADQARYLEITQLFDQIREDINDVQQRAKEERIRIGVLGGRGSGKSTLANALMGDNILPESAIIFCTNIPSTIQFSNQYFLSIRSELEQYNYTEKNIKPDKMKQDLLSICKESENPNNEKRVTKVTIGVPCGILDGKEIVDVPGFTRGNPLHQAFAERYAKHYCDVCLVIISNPESVQIAKHEGLEALVECFKNRLESTIFVINRCDESSESDIKYLKDHFLIFLKKKTSNKDLSPILFEISAKNTLNGNGKPFQFRNLLDYLAFLSSRKTLVLVKGFLERLISSFTLLKELCQLTISNLDFLERNIASLLKVELDAYVKRLRKGLEQTGDSFPDVVPQLDIGAFDLPSPIGKGAYQYANELVEHLRSQSNIIDEFIQQHQANIYQGVNALFERQISEFNQILQEKMREFESKFGITETMDTPKIKNGFQIRTFDPSAIERLKPLSLRVWVEKLFPENSIFTREVKFWLSPISVKVGPMGMKLGIPIGVRSNAEKKLEIQANIPKQALNIINQYVSDSLDNFARELYKVYSKVIDDFIDDWKKCLCEYETQIRVAKTLTSQDSVKQIDGLINELKESSKDVTRLMAQD